ncbi:glycosyl hydrolase [Yamadazyma tenuis]|uniref:Beta-mannosidase B n=1 Tax=Candida tenuis (strain ATCC 10573 / BCRC 21748 / CBS 615 / JCM 9827 / NBRC 10315 / NRRL Y-1498 / VKM Y-70) TaxID=590646 RepID=G3B6Z1_CANTC|nr:uncharacterized protein CANTEDRAFT_122769 [Yamadazyma tenuis ATCC 10573]EGV63053.1 hypothetical protein CANTEDRAFT_122769 [Yamadazyma tenuis ATCC 10573]WEJ97129.1 glycosyl hydrolase [Yamadazyma tenuis]
MQSYTLKNWSYRQAGTDTWKPARKDLETTEIHPDLFANGEIVDPFVDDNEKSLQWIGEKDWEYKASFDVTDKTASNHLLIFEGLDTFADVFLNGHKILSTESMFVQYQKQVKQYVQLDGPNELRIVFRAALLVARELEKKTFKAKGFNGESSRMQIRKAQYHYGWDWGPLFMTCGPYRPVRFVSYNSRIEDMYAKVSVAKDSASVDFQVSLDVTGPSVLELSVKSPDGHEVHHSKQDAVSGDNSIRFSLQNPQLWFPFSHGTPHLYDFTVSLKSQQGLETVTKRIGLRKVELVQEPFKDQPGTSFYFKVNDVPVYSSGSNWIPAHSFQTCLTKRDYEEWLQLMVDGNQNMIRVWGGGYYEQEVFYTECDRLGILVWQDFMFACGQYPAYPEYIKLVSDEVETQLKRLRNYCSLVLFAGNNEDYQVAEQVGLEWDKSDTSGHYEHTNFPARTLYEGVFPKLVSKFYPEVPYHPGSPWGGQDTADATIGDIHQWNVWHGSQEKYQDWYKLGGRFVSEFGMEALPSRKTYEACITDKSELYPQSYLVDFHNRSDGFERRLALYVIENIKVEGLDFDSWIYATQLMQAECLGYAYRCWRREWRGDGRRYSGGAIVWQINDCWPVASWAIVDHFKRPKLAYYSVRRESRPVGVGMYRNESKDPDPVLDIPDQEGAPFDYRPVHLAVDIWGVNSSLKDVKGTLKVDAYNVSTGERVGGLDDQSVVLKANQTSEFVKNMKISNKIPVVVYSRVVDEEGGIVASAGDWPQPLKYLKFPDRKVEIVVEKDQVVLTVNKPVKGVELSLESDLFIDDNGFDLFPGDSKVVKIKGLKSTDSVKVHYYQKQ